MSEDTTLADLLQLNLHKYEDEVRSIVDKAVKESGMEKVGHRCQHLNRVQRPPTLEESQHPSLSSPGRKSRKILAESI
jgi:dynein heavy chain